MSGCSLCEDKNIATDTRISLGSFHEGCVDRRRVLCSIFEEISTLINKKNYTSPMKPNQNI